MPESIQLTCNVEDVHSKRPDKESPIRILLLKLSTYISLDQIEILYADADTLKPFYGGLPLVCIADLKGSDRTFSLGFSDTDSGSVLLDKIPARLQESRLAAGAEKSIPIVLLFVMRLSRESAQTLLELNLRIKDRVLVSIEQAPAMEIETNQLTLEEAAAKAVVIPEIQRLVRKMDEDAKREGVWLTMTNA